ncbi:hypothetical protein RJ640_013430 [Escallonia rubra]|uniref:Domain X domain-containing protein n=1 Tax=Escallonia rubra TaxID=112253 RepID=A0AA88QIL3_9ASTE|nr:hypothetical protein RJ640_013430 [Escallonia rubra]
MWFVGVPRVYRRNLLNSTLLQRLNSMAALVGRPFETYQGRRVYYCTLEEVHDDKKNDFGKFTLAKSLAGLVEDSSSIEERKPKTRMELKRMVELRIKKRVKEQHMNGKFHDLMAKVISNPATLRDAYNSIRISSNVDLEPEGDYLPFESMALELSSGSFNVETNIFSISTRGANKEALVLPNLKLMVVQEAIRIALEVVYKPNFYKSSHGCRSGRSHSSALKYVCKEIANPDWWFTLHVNKKLDGCILTKLISTMECKLEDSSLYAIIRKMFDAQVLNLEFGGFPKGHGLPQEGVLSPILMNIYLDLFDREMYRMSMGYEALKTCPDVEQDGSNSKLRRWFRRQMNGPGVQSTVGENSGVRVHSCRFMDEILTVISGPKEVALASKSEIQSYLQHSLHLDVDNQTEILPCNGPHGIRFLGTFVKRGERESPAVRAVHKLKEKVKLFASQKRESWDAGTVRIGKKWLGHGLKKVKESEIRHLADQSSTLSQVSRFRKTGMETDHWYKVLLKVWMQTMNVKSAVHEGFLLSKYIVEPTLPQELRDSFYTFQKRAEEYVSSETASTLALLSCSHSESPTVTEIIAPVHAIKKRLLRYGLVNAKGNPRACYMLILQDNNQIIDWFSGIVCRWFSWYSLCDNFNEVKLIVSDQVRKSCIRTLAAKYRIHEADIENRFDSELSRLPVMQEIDGSNDEAFMYGISYSGLCLLSLARMTSQSRPCSCFVMGCMAAAPCVYTLQVMERQKFPGWKTGFSTSIHPSLHGRRIGLCKKHVKDLYGGHISLQSIDYGAWR